MMRPCPWPREAAVPRMFVDYRGAVDDGRLRGTIQPIDRLIGSCRTTEIQFGLVAANGKGHWFGTANEPASYVVDHAVGALPSAPTAKFRRTKRNRVTAVMHCNGECP